MSERKRTNVLSRFESKFVRLESGCWEWIGPCKPYGAFHFNGGMVRAHRMSFMLYRQENIPSGLVVMHLCQNYRCVNPDHLKLASNAENLRYDRGGVHPKVCKHGHEMTPENTLIRGNHHVCLKCYRKRQKVWYERYHLPYLREWRARKREAKPPKATCRKGHPWIPENIYHNEKTGWNYCKQCRKSRKQAIESTSSGF